MRKIFYPVILGLLTVSFNTFAAVAAKPEKNYQVEILVFETKEKAQDYVENAGKPAIQDAIALSSDNGPFTAVPDAELSLNDAKKKIQRKYRLVMHKGWSQAVKDKPNTKKLHLMGGKELENGHELDGTFKLSLGNHLTMDADFLMVDGNANPIRIKHTSKLKANEIHYIDHPQYGVIVMVTPQDKAVKKAG